MKTKTDEGHSTRPAAALRGEITVAPDKSISHRALIFSALARGESRIRNPLLGEDVLNTLRILNALGVKTSRGAEELRPGEELAVQGAGWSGLKAPRGVLYCGNSGTTMRLMLGLLSGAGLQADLTGDASLNRRPMERVIGPLSEMGGLFEIRGGEEDRVLRVLPNGGLRGIRYVSPVASAQVKTAVLLAGLNAQGETSVEEPAPSRDHTEILLAAMGADIARDGSRVAVRPGRELKPLRMTVPGDFSSAAFFVVAALIVPGSELFLRGVNLNPTRTGLLDVLLKMGADIRVTGERVEGGERVGDLRVTHSKLRNVPVGGAMIPRLIDEVPVLALAAMFAEGDFVLSDARELRVKETDRIRAVCHELSKLGGYVIEKSDGMTVVGGRSPKVRDKNLSTYGDHRVAMTLAVAGLAIGEALFLDDVACVATSFPGFFELLESVRAD